MAYRATDPFRIDYEPSRAGSDGGHTLATVNYALLIAGFFTAGVTAFVAALLAYLRRGSVPSTVRSHMDWQIRIFWHWVLAAIVIFTLHWVVIGLGTITFGVGLVFLVVPWGIGAWWLVWTIWAIVRGLQRLSRNLPMR